MIVAAFSSWLMSSIMFAVVGIWFYRRDRLAAVIVVGFLGLLTHVRPLTRIRHLHRHFRDLLSRFIYKIQYLIIALAVRPWRIRWVNPNFHLCGSISTAA